MMNSRDQGHGLGQVYRQKDQKKKIGKEKRSVSASSNRVNGSERSPGERGQGWRRAAGVRVMD